MTGVTAAPGGSERDHLVAVALGERPADLVITGGRLVNVYSGEIHAADIAIAGDRIATVGDVAHCIGDTTTRVDADGRHLVPGLIECHIHVGATSLTMTELARLLVPLGTAAIVTDFTEATKIGGPDAARVFLDEAARTPLQVFFSPFYTAMLGTQGRPGVSQEDFEAMLSWPECVELREWNVQSHRHASPQVRAVGEVARRQGLRLAGHMRAQSGRVLNASIASGTASDHEAWDVDEVVERVRAGVAVQMRFGSAHWHELEDMLRAVTERRIDPDLLMFSTDEQEVEDIADLGFMDHRIRTAIAMGVPALDAIRMGSLNAARYLGKSADLGGIAPGRRAFVNLVDDLRSFTITEVVAGDRVVARDGAFVDQLPAPSYPPHFFTSVKLAAPVTPADLAIAAPAGHARAEVRVIGFDRATTGTTELLLELPIEAGAVHADPGRDVAKLASIERIAGTGAIGVGLVHGLGMRRGAVAFSYHPGPSEIAVVGTDDADMALAANRIAELQGGFVVADGGRVVAEVPMPVLGIASDAPLEEVLAGFRRAKRIVREELGIDMPGAYYMLCILFIPGVAPRLRMSVRGLLRIELGADAVRVDVVPVVVAGIA